MVIVIGYTVYLNLFYHLISTHNFKILRYFLLVCICIMIARVFNVLGLFGDTKLIGFNWDLGFLKDFCFITYNKFSLVTMTLWLGLVAAIRSWTKSRRLNE